MAQTADEAYAEAHDQVQAELERLRAKLAEHAARHAADPGNWGFVGDLNHVVAVLKELMPGAPGDRFVWRDGDVELEKP